jgi:hypothetical protein
VSFEGRAGTKRHQRNSIRAAQLDDSYDVLRRTGMHDNIGEPGFVERLARRVLGAHCLAINHVIGAQREAQRFFQPIERVSSRQHDRGIVGVAISSRVSHGALRESLDHLAVDEREVGSPVERLHDLPYRKQVHGNLRVWTQLERSRPAPDLVDHDVGERAGRELPD